MPFSNVFSSFFFLFFFNIQDAEHNITLDILHLMKIQKKK